VLAIPQSLYGTAKGPTFKKSSHLKFKKQLNIKSMG